MELLDEPQRGGTNTSKFQHRGCQLTRLARQRKGTPCIWCATDESLVGLRVARVTATTTPGYPRTVDVGESRWMRAVHVRAPL